MRRIKIGLALGGGGPKGLAHIGVLKTLAKYKIPIDCIAGTSAGAIAGGFYAASLNIGEIEDYFMKKGWLETMQIAFDPSLGQGILQGRKVEDLLRKYLQGKQFKDLKIPFKAVTTNLIDGKTIVLDKDDLVKSIVASCSIPMIFKPVPLNGKLLADGGVTSPVPVETVRKMGADIVIAVNLYDHATDGKISEQDNFINAGIYTINLMIHKLSRVETQSADLIVCPDTSHIGLRTLLSQKGKEAGILEGEKAMEALIPELRHLIAKKQNEGIWERIKNFFKKVQTHYKI